ncbi:MAG TPA: hypothetical protein VK619_02730 [Pyrinomonadaceae bacterium]|nr:hypothetical protein [Pyrinomonadaceae bacterium]
MADATDLKKFEHARLGNPDVNGVKVGEPLTEFADGNAELRPATSISFEILFGWQSVETRRLPPKHRARYMEKASSRPQTVNLHR